MRLVRRSGLIALFLEIAASSSYNLAMLSDLGFKVSERNSGVFVESISSIIDASETALVPGDRLISVNGVPIVNRGQAKWLISDLLSTEPVAVIIQSGEERLSCSLTPARTHHPLFVFLNLILGITFIVVGLMVGWGGKNDPAGRAYFRLTCITGCSVLMFSPMNAFQPEFLHYFHSFGRITAQTLIAPLLVDFLLRFSGWSLGKLQRRLLYGPVLILAIITNVLFYFADRSRTPEAIWLFEWTFIGLVGIVLGIAFFVSIGGVIYGYIKAKDAALKHRMAWLVAVTAVGLLPYFIAHRLPMAFGFQPILPEWTVFGILMIVPIGWGMAVASFRMLNVEWALSRTITYMIAVGLAVYVLLTLALVMGDKIPGFKAMPLKTQLAAGAFLLAIGAVTLSSPVRWVIDRVYFRDWFNEREALHQLGDELTQAVVEMTVVEILTVRLPELLKVEKVTLLFSERDDLRLPTRSTEGEMEHRVEIIREADLLLTREQSNSSKSPAISEKLSGLGYEQFIPLRQGTQPVGALLIGRKQSGAMFSEKDLMLLGALSAHAAAALANIRLARQLLDQEKRALAADMAGGIAHEINNSLAPLMGQAELARFRIEADHSTGSDSIVPSLDIIVQMSDRIKRIAANLSRLSQPPSLEPEKLSLESVAAESLIIISETAGRIKNFREHDNEAPFKLKRELAGPDVLVWGDRQQLGQVFLNLIVNAADALEERGHGTLTVGVRREEEGRGAIGYVADDGPGIPSHLHDRIFQPYFTTKPKGKGTGLGLAIIRQIAEQHNGWVRLLSTPGLGARFEFFIPSTPSNSKMDPPV